MNCPETPAMAEARAALAKLNHLERWTVVSETPDYVTEWMETCIWFDKYQELSARITKDKP